MILLLHNEYVKRGVVCVTISSQDAWLVGAARGRMCDNINQRCMKSRIGPAGVIILNKSAQTFQRDQVNVIESECGKSLKQGN